MLRVLATLLPLLALAACGPVTDFNGYTDLEGTMTYRSLIDGEETLCDVQLELTGTPYTAHCSDCEFAFHVDPVVTADNSAEDCELPSLWTYVDDDFIDKSGMGYAPSTATFEGEPLDNALVAVGDLEGRRSTSAGIIGSGTPDAEVAWNGTDTLTWSYSFEESYGDLKDLDVTGACDPGEDWLPEVNGSKGSGKYSGTQSLPCDDMSADHWTFEGRADEAVTLYLDTVAEDSAFDTALYISGPDGCADAMSDDAFTCAFRPTEYDCAGGEFVPDTTGTYTVLVLNYGSCTHPDGDLGTGDYRLSIDAPRDPSLTLVEDNVEAYEHRLKVDLAGEVFVTRMDGTQ